MPHAESRLHGLFLGCGDHRAADLFELTPADDKPIEVIGLFLSQSSDAGDAQAKLLPYRVIRGFTDFGVRQVGDSAASIGRSDSAAGFTAETYSTTGATTGTTNDLHASAFSVQVGEALWLPGWVRVVGVAGGHDAGGLSCGRPAGSLTMSGTVYVREQG